MSSRIIVGPVRNVCPHEIIEVDGRDIWGPPIEKGEKKGKLDRNFVFPAPAKSKEEGVDGDKTMTAASMKKRTAEEKKEESAFGRVLTPAGEEVGKRLGGDNWAKKAQRGRATLPVEWTGLAVGETATAPRRGEIKLRSKEEQLEAPRRGLRLKRRAIKKSSGDDDEPEFQIHEDEDADADTEMQ